MCGDGVSVPELGSGCDQWMRYGVFRDIDVQLTATRLEKH